MKSGDSMKRRVQRTVAGLTALGLAGFMVKAHAQTVSSITASTPNIGNVVSAPTGTTVFQVEETSGAVSKISGNGARLSTGTSRPLVTIACSTNTCNNKALTVRVGSVGSPTGRAQALTNFTVCQCGGTATISGVSGTNPVSFTIAGFANGSSRTFYVGADFPISGNDTASATGSATSGFYVYVAVSPTVPTVGSTSGLARANVFRPIALSASTGLAFGKIVRPSTGTGTVAVDNATGARTVTGTGAIGLSSPTPTRASYTVSGEGGQVFTLSFPTSFQMTGPGPALTVTLNPTTPSGSKTLSSTLGSAGTLAFQMGGSFPISSTTTTGAYSGSYTVSVTYN
jgi:hypothetical protein